MKLLFEPPPVFFMHVPKTAGVSLGNWLHTSYGWHYLDLDVSKLSRFTTAKLKPFRCYHSWHYGRSMFDLIARDDLYVITMLRDPVERTVSAFRHRQREALKQPEKFTEDYLQGIRPILHSELQDCLDHDLITHTLSNGQTRLLGGRKEYAAYLKHGTRSQPFDRLTQPGQPVKRSDIPWLIDPNDHELLFSNACAWLKEMDVVGLTERYAESVLLIADLLGIPAPADMPAANVNPQRTSPAMRYRDQMAPAVVARLEELNRYDLELYTCATDLFEQQWARYQAHPQRMYSIAAHIRHRLRLK